MKIVMLCEFYNETLEFQENLLTRYYTKHGHQVVVITSTFDSVFDYYSGKHDNSTPGRVYNDGAAKIIKLPFKYNILNRLRRYTDISKILKDEAPDLIYVHDIMLNLPEAVRYKKQHPHCKIIMDYHADYSNSGKNWLSLKILHGVCRKWFLDRARKHLSRIFPIVPSGITFLHEVYSVPLNEMEVLPLGADTDQGKKAHASGAGAKIREKLGIAPSDLVVFTGGKLSARKRTELLIRAVKKLSRSDVHLIIVGESGDGDTSYKDMLLKEAAGSKNIHFIGWLNSADVYSYLDAADMALFPASQSIMWQQSISMGLPVVVGDTGQQDPSYLNLHQNMIILKKEQINEVQIHSVLERLLGDAQLRAQMSSGAKKTTEELLNWDTLIERTLRFNRS